MTVNTAFTKAAFPVHYFVVPRFRCIYYKTAAETVRRSIVFRLSWFWRYISTKVHSTWGRVNSLWFHVFHLLLHKGSTAFGYNTKCRRVTDCVLKINHSSVQLLHRIRIWTQLLGNHLYTAGDFSSFRKSYHEMLMTLIVPLHEKSQFWFLRPIESDIYLFFSSF